MKSFLKFAVITFLLTSFGCSEESAPLNLKDLEGAWWSISDSPTADFAIIGNKVWLDSFEELQDCQIRGNTLVFILEGDAGEVENEIISLHGNVLVLKSGVTRKSTTLLRID